jgi:hypothetical protein
VRVVVALGTAVLALVVGAVSLLVWASGDRTDPHLTAAAVHGAHTEPGPYAVWDRNDDGSPVRWDPCSPIEVVVRPDPALPQLLDDTAAAIDRLREASGLDLRLVGTTDEQPHADRAPYAATAAGLRWAPVLVGTASPGAHGLPLRDTDRGVAIPLAVGTPGDRVYVSGQVVLNRDRDDLVPGYDDRATSWGATVLHELAHVLGLAHVDDPAELLWTYPGEGPVELGPGDRAGLTAVGAEDGCLEVPTPQPVEVVGP